MNLVRPFNHAKRAFEVWRRMVRKPAFRRTAPAASANTASSSTIRICFFRTATSACLPQEALNCTRRYAYRPYRRPLITVKNVPNCRKQNIGHERFEQVLASTRNQGQCLCGSPVISMTAAPTFSAKAATSGPSGRTASISTKSMCEVRKIACASSTVLAELTRYSSPASFGGRPKPMVRPRQSGCGYRWPLAPPFRTLAYKCVSVLRRSASMRLILARYSCRSHDRSFHVGFGTR